MIELEILIVWKFKFVNGLSPGEGDVKHIYQDAIMYVIIKIANISPNKTVKRVQMDGMTILGYDILHKIYHLMRDTTK